MAILVTAIFAATLVNAKDYTVGVKAGDWIKYGQITITWTGNGTGPPYVTNAKMVNWIRFDVLSVTGTTVSLNETFHYNNGTETVQSSDVDIQGGPMGGALLIASNLTAGDPLNPQTPGTTINETVTRFYAGANRNVNIIDTKSSFDGYQSETKIYWDQETGIMVELYQNETDPTYPGGYEEESVKATETNLWSPSALDLIQDNLIFIIAGTTAVIVIVAAIIAIRRRNPPSSQQPPPPSAPPPPPP